MFYLFFSKSRISVSNLMSSEGSAGAAAFSSSFFFFVKAVMPFTIRKIQNAMIRKSSTF